MILYSYQQAWELQLLCIITNVEAFLIFWILAIPVHDKQYLTVVFIFISLIASDIDYFGHLLAFFKSSFIKLVLLLLFSH